MDNPAMYFVPNSNAKAYSNHGFSDAQSKEYDSDSYYNAHANAKSVVFIQIGSVTCPILHIVGHSHM